MELLARKVQEFSAAAQGFKEGAMRLASRFGSLERRQVFLKLLVPVFAEVMEEADRLKTYALEEMKQYKKDRNDVRQD